MASRTHSSRGGWIHCDNCGEDYNDSYKRCPFCGARPERTPKSQGGQAGRGASSIGEEEFEFDGQGAFDDEVERDSRRGGGKRLADDDGLPMTTIAGIAFSALLVISAILIVVLVILPMIRAGQTSTAENDPNKNLSGSSPNPTLPISSSNAPESPGNPVDPDPAGTTGTTPPEDPENPNPSGSESPSPSSSPSASISPAPSASTPPASGSITITDARGKTLTEFTISEKYPNPVQLKAAGSSGKVTWSSSNTKAVTVSSSGVVTAVGKGSAKITATDATGNSKSCNVRSYITGSGGSQPSSSTAPSSSPSQSTAPSGGNLSLSRSDFTLDSAHPTYTIKASGGSGAVTWTSSKPEVATVDANGKVTRVSKGKCVVTAVDASGQKAECIVRCS